MDCFASPVRGGQQLQDDDEEDGAPNAKGDECKGEEDDDNDNVMGDCHLHDQPEQPPHCFLSQPKLHTLSVLAK